MINDLFSKVLEEKNEQELTKTKTKVKNLVDGILRCEAEIAKLRQEVIDFKAELKALQMPEEIKLEL